MCVEFSWVHVCGGWVGATSVSGKVRKSLETTLKHGPTMAKSLLGACLVYVCMSSCCHKF